MSASVEELEERVRGLNRLLWLVVSQVGGSVTIERMTMLQMRPATDEIRIDGARPIDGAVVIQAISNRSLI